MIYSGLAVRRRPGSGKRDKDLKQAQNLIWPLAERRPKELRTVWQEAFDRGPTWRELRSLFRLMCRAGTKSYAAAGPVGHRFRCALPPSLRGKAYKETFQAFKEHP